MVSILVTAGPTREYLDDVRFLANGSTGRMGYALCEAALERAHRVWLVLGPVELPPPAGVELLPVTSALEMQAAAERAFADCQIAIGAAAVADWRPAVRQPGKPPRRGERMQLELVQNPDIIAGLAKQKGERIVVGFALESDAAGIDAAVARGAGKLQQKQLDMVVINQSSAIGAEASAVVLLFADGHREALPPQDKKATAARIIEAAVQLWETRRRGG
jgi:phosphopantothenoylcysteine decarboxylase/phosphopantothenate--cysteine ligase